MTLLITTPRIVCSSVAIAVGAYAAATYRSISSVPQTSITSNLKISESFATSHTYTELINPRHHAYATDSRSVTLKLPKGNAASCTDETLLNAALKGFFGGWIFTPERIGLGVLNIPVGPFPDVPAAPSQSISNISQLSSARLSQPYTTFFSAFQVIHSNIVDAAKHPSESTVDVAFGSPTSGFSGCHRLSVRRGLPGNSEEDVTMSLECVAGNPTHDKPVGPGFVLIFHRVYADLLFRSAVAEVKRELAVKGLQ